MDLKKCLKDAIVIIKDIIAKGENIWEAFKIVEVKRPNGINRMDI